MESSSTRTRRTDFILLLTPAAACVAIPGPGVILAALIVVTVLIVRRDVRGAVLRLWWRGPMSSIALGIAAGVAVVMLDASVIEPLVQHFIHSQPNVGALGTIQGNLPAYLRLLGIALVIGGIAEELVFRGFLIGWSCRLMGEQTVLPAMVLSSALFGFSHLYQGLAGVVETGIIGVLLATLYVGVGRRLLPGSFAHMTIDAFGITELYTNGAITHFVAHLLGRV